MFYGEYQHSIDSKGRAIIPSKFRYDLGETFILTKGMDGCLFGYSSDEWEVIISKLKSQPLTNKNVRIFSRLFFSGAAECPLDKQGRILIPQKLREYAGLGKDIFIIGVSTRIEIWDKEKWEKFNNEEDLNSDSMAEQLAELGI